eukprot:s1930_g7.t1
MINQVTVITEKLQLPSTDANVAALRRLRQIRPEDDLAGWVLDERKAYRQVAVRSAAINEFLVELFGLVAFSFYDDKYGFEPAQLAPSAKWIAESVHHWLGAKFDRKKLQLSSAPTILGVTYNLAKFQLEIKPERKEELTAEIDGILSAGLLDPGSAGKLKGKLMFGASQLWGKVGRAFLRVISERQYLRFPISSEFRLDPPLREALRHWKMLVNEGPPRTIDIIMVPTKLSDVVIFTDGFTPDPRTNDRKPDRVGDSLRFSRSR